MSPRGSSRGRLTSSTERCRHKTVAANNENSRDAIAEQAAEWFVMNASKFPGDTERRQFVAWLRSSPIHVEEYLAVATIASELPAAAALVEDTLWGIPERTRTAEAPTLSMAAAAIAHWRRFQDRVGASGLRVAAAAAGTLLVVALVVGTQWVHRAAPQAVPESYRTAHGQQGAWKLADGSSIRLNTDSAVTVSFTATERVVQLTRGQAFFAVAHEPRRPFRVAVNSMQVMAVGTQFDVYRREDSAAVTVIEGRVAVLAPNQPKGQTLGAGQRILIGPGVAAVPQLADLGQAEAWLHRQVIFRMRPLGEVVDEFNRYALTHIEITDPLARAIAVSGVFDAYDTESFLAFVATIDGLTVQAVPPANQLISRKHTS
jgi:transmembrane sensor